MKKGDRMDMLNRLTAAGVKAEMRMLPLGDMIWIARAKAGGEEIVLDAIVERKRLDDLCSSIIDGRYTSQKVRRRSSFTAADRTLTWVYARSV
jgi:ERCC4-type nuclease